VASGWTAASYADADWDWNRIGEAAGGSAFSGGGLVGEPGMSKPVNSKPYGVYGGNGAQGEGSEGGSRPNSAAANRPTTAATAGAHAGSIGKHIYKK